MAQTQILIVEDEPIIARDLEETLTRLGYIVTAIASSGEDAVKKIVEHRHDLVLMDIILKGSIDGIETAGGRDLNSRSPCEDSGFQGQFNLKIASS